MKAIRREPAVAGRFYPADVDKLRTTLGVFFQRAAEKLKGVLDVAGDDIIGLVSPHAGYIYSGPTAAVSFFTVKDSPREVVFILGPNHHGYGHEISIAPHSLWVTPLGELDVDLEVASELVERGRSRGLDIGFSEEAHLFEHSIEVQLPFLMEVWGGRSFRIVPIVLKYQRPRDMAALGNVIAELSHNRSVLLVASSDMSHYVPHEVAVELDSKSFPYVESLDWEGLYRVVAENNITACGVGAIASVMVASSLLGATAGKVLEYTTSAAASGDYGHVVGYMSAITYKR